MVEKCIQLQSSLCKILTVVVRIVLVVVEESIDNAQGSGSKSAAPFTNMLINLE